MGIVAIKRTGDTLLHPKPHPARCRIQQLLEINSCVLNEKTPIAQGAVLFLPSMDSKLTEDAAKNVSILEGEDGIKLALDDGTKVNINLDTLSADISRSR